MIAPPDPDDLVEGKWTLFDFDVDTQTATYVMVDGDQYHVKTERNIDGVIKVNRECRAASDPGWKGDVHLVAAIPSHLFYDSSIGEAAAVHDSDYALKWLNDSDHEVFRVKEGVL